MFGVQDNGEKESAAANLEGDVTMHDGGISKPQTTIGSSSTHRTLNSVVKKALVASSIFLLGALCSVVCSLLTDVGCPVDVVEVRAWRPAHL